jgi:hypothetical protein
VTKDGTVQIELQMPEPVGGFDQGWSMAKCGIRQSDAVFCRAESDFLVQNELSHFTIIYAWFKIAG